MSPTAHSVYAVARAGTMPSPISISYIRPRAPLTMPSQQATDPPPSPTAIHVDTSVPSAMVSPALESETPLGQGRTPGTKIGLSMIPVVVCLCAIWVVCIFWWRKQRARKVMHMGPPPVPKKDQISPAGSIDSGRRGSKVFSMAAFSTPIHDGRCREAQVMGQSGLYNQTPFTSHRKKHQMNATIARLADPRMPEEYMDSPIDGKSPFRLKRGDTVKRCSLGSEISSLWLSPPPSAWVRKQTSMNERVTSPSASRGASF